MFFMKGELMSTPFIAEIKIVSFNFAPKGWALCNGQLLPINQNQALFSLLGTTYGGDGRTTFALPDLRGRTPIHMGNGSILGENGGEESHTMSITEMPTHIHLAQGATVDGDTPVPTANILAAPTGQVYAPANNLTPLDPGSVSPVGGNQAHENMQPYLTLNFVIALQGIFPSRN
jgi:microcystin-dependent protein